MALSYAFALATITQQITKLQESVNGAFKPLMSTVACEMPRMLDAKEAFRRCTSIAHRSHSIEEMARQGMGLLLRVREEQHEFDEKSLEIIAHLEALAKATRAAKIHLLEMFAEAERSPMWQGSNLAMLRPLKKGYVKALTALDNTACQLAIEISQRAPFNGEFLPSDISREDSIDLINASHRIYGAEPPKWM